MIKLFASIIVFIILSTWNFELLINRESSTIYTLLSILIESILFYFLIYKPIKKQL